MLSMPGHNSSYVDWPDGPGNLARRACHDQSLAGLLLHNPVHLSLSAILGAPISFRRGLLLPFEPGDFAFCVLLLGTAVFLN